MIHWAWIIVSSVLGAIVGGGVAALFLVCWVINKLDKEEQRTLDEYMNREIR